MTDYVDLCRTRLRRQGYAMSFTSGKSMRPLIWEGQHCVAVVRLEGDPVPGDLLLFVKRLHGEERTILHRLVEIRQSGGRCLYITRGDNCLLCEQVRRSEILGRVAEVHRMSGFRPWHAIPRKSFAVTDTAYLIYTRIWETIWPVRRVCYRLRGYARALAARMSLKH